jgi:hypothetical protein
VTLAGVITPGEWAEGLRSIPQGLKPKLILRHIRHGDPEGIPAVPSQNSVSIGVFSEL